MRLIDGAYWVVFSGPICHLNMCTQHGDHIVVPGKTGKPADALAIGFPVLYVDQARINRITRQQPSSLAVVKGNTLFLVSRRLENKNLAPPKLNVAIISSAISCVQKCSEARRMGRHKFNACLSGKLLITPAVIAMTMRVEY